MLFNTKMKKIIFWLLVTMVVSFAIAGSILMAGGFDNTILNSIGNTRQENINVEKSFAVSGIKSVDIDTVSTDITIIPVDSNEVRVHFHGSARSNNNAAAPELIAEMKGSELDIQVKHKVKVTIGINIVDYNLKLDIYMPNVYTEGINASTTSGRLSVSGLSLDKLAFSSVSGDFKAESLRTNQTKFNTTSGRMDAEQFTGDIDFSSVSGDASVEYAAFHHNIKVQTTSGGARFKLPEDSQFNLDFSSTSGKVRCDFPITVQGLNRRGDVAKGSVGSSNNSINVTTVSGDLEIHK